MLTGYNHLYEMKNDYALIDFHIRQSQSPRNYIFIVSEQYYN